MSEHMALENLTVLDLTRVLAGPFCTMMLADMGANVIKIEVPKGGDDTRTYPPFRAKNLNGERESVYFANINRNKKGITLNLKAPEGKEIFKELVKKADIVVENYRPGVMDKLGLGYDVLKEINPRIIYAAVSGFGCYGPYHLRPGYDILAQAMGGMMSITGSKGGEPTRAGSALGDILGGLHVTIGILAAVNARTITGKGQRVDVSLMDSMIAATENTALKYIETGNIPAPMGNRYAAVSPYDSFTCKGGKVIIAAGNQKLYEKLCNEVLERPDMITDPRFVDMPGRLANQDAIAEVIEERIKDLTPNEAAELVLALPTFIDLLQITDSSLAPGLSTSTLLTLSRVCSVLSFLLMIVRGLYGKWLYRQSAAEKIRRIRAEFPDAAQRKAVLCAQGGTSWAAVLGCLVLLMVIGSAFTLLLGPNVDALIHLVYG